MAQSEIIGALVPMEPATDISVATKTASRTPNNTTEVTLTYPDPPAYFHEALQDAERMLKYAAEIGIDIGADTRDHVLQARASSSDGWNEETTANLLAALTKLAAQ